MKASLKLQDNQNHHHKTTDSSSSPPLLLLRAKVPITIFNQPFLSHFSTTTTHPSNLSLSLSTNFHSCPSLKITYSTSTTATSPLTLSLKSGTGIFGSPKNSPLVISAHFSFNPSNPTYPNPTFSLLLKPQLGSFSIRKTTFSNPKPDVGISNVSENVDSGGELSSNGFAFVALDKMEQRDDNSIMDGIVLNADTRMVMGKKAGLNFRWKMDFRADKMPVLRINKVGIETVEEIGKIDDEKENKNSKSEVKMLKGMCLWMGKELDGLRRVNREMKCELAEIRDGHLVRNDGYVGNDVRKKGVPAAVGRVSSGFDQWKKKKDGGSDESGSFSKKKDEGKSGGLAVDVESELEKAIKAASGS